MKQKLMNNENLLKEYNAFKGKNSFCDIAVTNKRLILTQSSKSFFNKMECSKEVDIKEVNSIATKYCKRISFWGLILVLIIATAIFSYSKSNLALGMIGSFVFFVLGIVLLTIFAPKAGTILIYTSTSESVRIGLSLDFNGSRKSKRFIIRRAKLGKDFVALCEELGAIVKAIQTGEKVELSSL